MDVSVIAFAPIAVIVAFLLAAATHTVAPRWTRPASLAAGVFSALTAFAALAVILIAGPAESFALTIHNIGLATRLDAFSAVMFALVTFVGAIVIHYARRYLDGDPDQPSFFARLALILAAVVTLVTAGDVILLTGAWVAMSLALHALLVFRPERPGAVLAARKKFVLARVGDLALIGAAGLLVIAFDSTRLGDILAMAAATREAGDPTPPAAAVAAVLIALAAALKAAQFPTHGWLTEVMETPTPVSALLHAGVVNAGGFLVIRFADVMLLSPAALHILAVIGGVTAVFGAVAMLTQPAVKTALAYSTVGQMGFMLLQCGLGAFAPATLHIVAHSLYKAHAFLASGGAVTAAAKPAPKTPAAGPVAVFASLIAAGAVYTATTTAFGYGLDRTPALWGLGAVFVLGVFVMLARAAGDGRVLVRAVGLSAAASVAYVALQAASSAMLGGVLPAPPTPGPIGVAVLAVIVASFAALAALQTHTPERASDLARALYVHLANGLYANAMLNRLAGGLSLRLRASRRAATRPSL